MQTVPFTDGPRSSCAVLLGGIGEVFWEEGGMRMLDEEWSQPLIMSSHGPRGKRRYGK